MSGKQVYITRGVVNSNYRFGEGFTNGMYIVETRQDNKTSKLVLVKQ